MLAASVEYDDRPGAVRDLLVAGQREACAERSPRLSALRSTRVTSGPQTDPWQLGVRAARHRARRSITTAGLLDDARSLAARKPRSSALIETHRPVAGS